jgi:hypothetical protein
MTGVIVASYIVNAIVLVYAISVPSARWLAADRDKFFWVLLIGIFGLAAVAGVIVDVAFLIGVAPRFGPASSSGRAGTSDARGKAANPFLKS